jgi:hypothetical protein
MDKSEGWFEKYPAAANMSGNLNDPWRFTPCPRPRPSDM